MYKLFLSCFFVIICIFINNTLYAQDYETSSAGGEWTDNSYWLNGIGSAPPYTGVTPSVYVNHRIHSDDSIVFADGGTNKDHLYVYDTLVIYGSLTLGSFDDVTIGTNGLLLIFGDFTSQNQVNIANGGFLVVLGNFYLPQGGTSFGNIDTARTYIVGDVDIPNNGADDLDCDPDIDTACGYGDGSDLFEDPIFDFINEISDQTCSITLSASITDESSVGASDGAIDVTLTGATSPSYSWSNDSVTQDISGLAAGDYSLVVFDGICVIDTSFTVSVPCTVPTIDGTTPDSCCGTGTVTLGATASAGIINWYDVSTGGSSLGTGTTFVTPSISTTTTYYVDATDGGCTTASRTAVTATVNPNPLATLTANVAFDSICTGNNTEISISFTAGTAPFDFTISDGTTSEPLSNISANPYTYTPATAPVWIDDATPDTDYFYTITTITDDKGCSNTNQGNEKVTVFKIPETGPQYHIDSNFNP